MVVVVRPGFVSVVVPDRSVVLVAAVPAVPVPDALDWPPKPPDWLWRWTRRLFCTCLTPETRSAMSSARRFASRLSTEPDVDRARQCHLAPSCASLTAVPVPRL